MTTNTLLVEIVTEELPPKALSQLGAAFRAEIIGGLKTRGLLVSDRPRGALLATPRRLAVVIPDVLARSADEKTRIKILPVNIAVDDRGNPTPALDKKLAALGFPQLTITDFQRAADGKAESFFYTYTAPGIPLAEGLQVVLADTVATLPIPKVMRYQTETGDDVEFVRPAHGLVALHGADVVPISVLGLAAGRITHGHRFQGAKDIMLSHADEYESRLREEGGVIASFVARRAEIERQLHQRATALGADLKLAERDALLDEVTALVEMPTVYVGEFEKEFLAVPQECLILTMQANQKYFPLFNGAGKLLNKFLIVSNMHLDDPKNIVEGNQRVIRPRLADARFFFEQDKKVRLVDRVPQLEHVIYHNKMSLQQSQRDRVERLQQLVLGIAERLGVDPALADRAALLCKVDLVTNMVGEFPELQGTMGRYYALNDGEDWRVADAIEAHYRPRFAGDSLPDAGVSTVLALADKLDTLVGIFGVGQAPTGDKDPFALRRAALGVLRILLELKLPLDLWDEVKRAGLTLNNQYISKPKSPQAAFQRPASPPILEHVYEFLIGRLRNYLREKGLEPEVVDAVLSQNPTRIDLVPPRIEAVRAFRKLPEAEALSAANKRTRNILKKADGIGDAYDPTIRAESAERQLHASVARLAPEVATRVDAQDYTGALKQLAGIRGDVDKFFDDVLVMADDPVVRANRLALLSQLEKLMNQVADISKLAT